MDLCFLNMSTSSEKTEKTRIHLRRFKLKDILRAKHIPINVLIVGTSTSRKVACVQDILGSAANAAAVFTEDKNVWGNMQTVSASEGGLSSIMRSKIRVIEMPQHLEDLDLSKLEKVLSTGDINIVCQSNYTLSDTSLVRRMTHVIALGGLTQIRGLWSDFGGLIPKYKDFRQIYLACTDEGDRYSDSFLNIIIDPTITDPSVVFSWGSLHRDQVKDISIDIERYLVLAKVQAAKTVQIAQPTASVAQIADTSDITSAEPIAASEPKGDDEREPRAECVIA